MTAIPLSDPPRAAKTAGLRYVSRDSLTIRRERVVEGFVFTDARGVEIVDLDALDRIHRLGIPPAWTEVRISPRDDSHLQAVGRDAKGRLQYRYHPSWREIRDESKFDRMLEFGRSLPRIRQRIENDLALPGLPREKVLAAVVQLIATTLIRVGNDEYAKGNDSFGATTLRDQHAEFTGARVRLRFRAKSGKEAEIDFRDRRLAKIMRKCQDLPGQELFQYVDAQGLIHDVVSDDVNTYLREITGQDFTAKDFRTFFATLYAAQELACAEAATSQRMAKSVVKRALEEVAGRLGNTVAICRKSYVHPAIVEAYHTGAIGALSVLTDVDPGKADEAERLVVDFLAEHLNRKKPPRRRPADLATALARSVALEDRKKRPSRRARRS